MEKIIIRIYIFSSNIIIRLKKREGKNDLAFDLSVWTKRKEFPSRVF